MSEAETEDTRTTMYKELTRAKACVRLLQIHHFRNGIDLPSSCSLGIVGTTSFFSRLYAQSLHAFADQHQNGCKCSRERGEERARESTFRT